MVERRKTVMKKEGWRGGGLCGSQTGFPLLGAADLRTLAKARQNRMWKIEFTKQLGIELIYLLHRRRRERDGGR